MDKLVEVALHKVDFTAKDIPSLFGGPSKKHPRVKLALAAIKALEAAIKAL